MVRIGFFGTPTLAARVLEDLTASGTFEIVFVVTNPDKPFGRSSEMKASPVKEYAMKHGIEILQPERIRENHTFLDQLRTYDCDYFIVVAYGKILPLELLEIPKKKCINVHGSILPKYRGASPIQAALLHGERETGVTIMEMSEGMDEGDILKIRFIDIDSEETSETLFEKFSTVSGSTLIQALLELEHGGITPLPQNHNEATYCKKIEKEDGLVDWNKSAEVLYHMWQAYTPWPGIYTMFEGKRLLLEKVSLSRHRERSETERGDSEIQKGIPDTSLIAHPQGVYGLSQARKDGTIGQVQKLEDGRIGVTCAEGILTLEQVKLEGKKSQNIMDFLNGQTKFIGNFL